jgi:chromosome segregation ATPase
MKNVLKLVSLILAVSFISASTSPVIAKQTFINQQSEGSAEWEEWWADWQQRLQYENLPAFLHGRPFIWLYEQILLNRELIENLEKALRENVEYLEGLINQNRRMINLLGTRVSMLEENVFLIWEEMFFLRSEMEMLEENVKQNREKIENLESELIELEEEMLNKISELWKALSEFENWVNYQLKLIHAQLSEHENRIENLEKTVENHARKLDVLEAEINILQFEVLKMENEVVVLERKTENMQTAITELQEKMIQQAENIEILKKHIQSLTSEVEKLSILAQELLQQIDVLEDKMTSCEKKLAKVESKVQKLQFEYDRLTLFTLRLIFEVQQCEQDIRIAQNAIRSLRWSLLELRRLQDRRYYELKSKIANLSRRISVNESRITTALTMSRNAISKAEYVSRSIYQLQHRVSNVERTLWDIRHGIRATAQKVLGMIGTLWGLITIVYTLVGLGAFATGPVVGAALSFIGTILTTFSYALMWV